MLSVKIAFLVNISFLIVYTTENPIVELKEPLDIIFL